MEELVKIVASKNVPLVEDLGSGAFFDIATFGLKKEQTVKEVIESGVNVVTFSGDKLLGGPQAGIIAGDAELVGRIRKNPMYRALRADKLILSLIENTLSLYLAPAQLMVSSLPVLALSAANGRFQSQRRIVHASFDIALNELSNDFGVGVGGELDAFGF